MLDVPAGGVPEAAAAVRDGVGGRPVVALGGGRVVDSAKAIGGADGLPVAAVPTTLSGAELTPFHRMPAGVSEFRLVRPSLVVADPALMASQPMPDLAASAMNALAHAVEALYTPLANPVAEMAALRAAELIAEGLEREEPGSPGARAGRGAGRLRRRADRLRRAPRRLPDDRARVRDAALADQLGDAAALRALHGAARAARDRPAAARRSAAMSRNAWPACRAGGVPGSVSSV